jgi:hypothetical protein
VSLASSADFARRAGALRDRVTGEPPQTWRPDQGHPNPIIGEYVREDSGTGYQGRTVKIAVLRTPEGEWGVWQLHQVLEEEFERQNPKPGELVAVSYLGKAAKGFHRYRLAVDRDALSGDRGSRSVPPFAGDEPSNAVRGSDDVRNCELCAYPEPEHADGCPNDLPPF